MKTTLHLIAEDIRPVKRDHHVPPRSQWQFAADIAERVKLCAALANHAEFGRLHPEQ